MPVVVSTGYIRLVCNLAQHNMQLANTIRSKRVVVMKDQTNKLAHEHSAQLACEAAGSIRTVASLTREDDCLNLYSRSLDVPLRKSSRTAIWSNLLFAFSQAVSCVDLCFISLRLHPDWLLCSRFFVISLIFWYGSRLVSTFEVSTFAFFVALMVR
jgi:ATP-binding cassette subfamily B (MDR/TAP) protein 1